MSLKSNVKNTLKLLRSKKMVPIPQPVNVQKLLAGKIALITGGSGGIGFAMAKAFLDSGCKVIIAGTNEKKLWNCCEKLMAECSDLSAECMENSYAGSMVGDAGGGMRVHRTQCA